LAATIDAGTLAAWTLVVVGLCSLGARAGWLPAADSLLGQLLIGVLVVAPALAAFSALEAGRGQGTPGKRLFELRVLPASGHAKIGFGKTLLRNALKLALPLLLLHQAVLAAAYGGPGPATWISVGVAAALPLAYLGGMCVGPGRTFYDYLLGTQVGQRAARASLPDDWPSDVDTMMLPRVSLSGEVAHAAPRRAI
jgi:uncharacterized RDD family membrane protein YckC